MADGTDAGQATRGASRRGAITPADPASVDVLLKRVVVVDGPRSAELIAGLAESGIPARSVNGDTLPSLIAGLVIFEGDGVPSSIRDPIRLLRRRQAPFGALALADSDRCAPSLLGDVADAVLPSSAPAELIAAQLRAMARLIATEAPAGEPEVITIRNVTVDLEQRHVRVGDRVLDLTPTEFLLLAHLARRRGVVSHAELVEEVHGSGMSEREAKNMLKVHIWRLRSKLAEALPDTNLIVTVRGFGYLIERRNTNRGPQPRGPA